MANTYRTPSDIHPSLTYDDAAAAIDWLCRAFGFAKRLVVPGENGRIEHSELSLGSGVVMVSSPKAGMNLVSPKDLSGRRAHGLSVCVADPDSHYRTAVAAGAKIVRPLQDEEYGDDGKSRGYAAEDLEGHFWYFGNYRPGGYWE